MGYRLTGKAEEDVIRIFRDGARLFGLAQAESYHDELEAVFGLIGRHHGIARERTEITPAIRVHPHKAHLIIYIVDPDGNALIVRVRHGHEDWANDEG